MVAPQEVPRLLVADRLSLRWRMARAWRAGTAARRAACVAAMQHFEGSAVRDLRRRPGELLAHSELHLDGGTVVSVGYSHGPTVDRLAGALRSGPVRIQRVADHRRFFGLYFQTHDGLLALLVNEMTIRHDGGGLRRPALQPA